VSSYKLPLKMVVRAWQKMFEWPKTASKFGKTYAIVQPGKVGPTRHIPEHITKPDYTASNLALVAMSQKIDKKLGDDFRRMEAACHLAKTVLEAAKNFIQVGVTTDDIDHVVHSEIIKNDAYPSPLNYKGFPKSCCTSVNNVTCHGIPDDYVLQDGDVINVDVSVYYDGFHGDTSDTYPVGTVDSQAAKLIRVTRECLKFAIDACAPGERFNVIGDVIQEHAQNNDFSVCPYFIGHGIGKYFHGPPNVWHTKKRRRLEIMETGMTFTIEPILMEGVSSIKRLDDKWTCISRDNGRSAQAEHTLWLGEKSAHILT